MIGEILRRDAALTEEALRGALPPTGGLQQTVVEAMSYSLLGGGKRIRAALVLEFARACGVTDDRALPFACAMEMMHASSLIHDDLPCMDNDDMRRGKPSCHKAFGEDMALLAGDGLMLLSLETLLKADRARIGDAYVRRAAEDLAHAAGPQGMVGGQVIDLQSEGKAVDRHTLETMHRGKTGAMIIAACLLGCRAAGAGEAACDAARAYGAGIGMTFQIVDDILDVEGDAAKLGKPIGSDADNHKTTFYTLLGPDAARAEAARLTADAKAAVTAAFGPAAQTLCDLADALLTRDH